MLWHLRFIYSECFSVCPLPDLFNTKSTNVKSSYTRGIYIKKNSAQDIYARSVSVIVVYTGVANLRGICSGNTCIKNTFTRSV